MSRILSLAALIGLALIWTWREVGKVPGVTAVLPVSQTGEFVPASEIYVIDGDTIRRGHDRYRLKGFDTPETRNSRCKRERALGYAAKDLLRQIVRKNGGLELVVARRRDKYGRFLAEAYAGGAAVRDLLISEGLARPYSGGKRLPWCKEEER
jgi:endonuclease YncB( thermonuclease family)